MSSPPGTCFVDRTCEALCTLGPIGRVPRMPGTAGTAAAAALAAALWAAAATPFLWTAVGAAVFSAICLLCGSRVEKSLGQKDPPRVVADEAAGYLVAVCGLETSMPGASGWWLGLLVAFVLFRLLDIVKPFPLDRLQKLPGGWGILADDLGAGLAANLLQRLAWQLFPGLLA